MARKNQNTLVVGDWNALCDQCGRKFKASDLRKRWDGFMVCEQDWEPRHPQDFIRPVKDEQRVPWTRSEPSNNFKATSYDTATGNLVSRTVGLNDNPLPGDDNPRYFGGGFGKVGVLGDTVTPDASTVSISSPAAAATVGGNVAIAVTAASTDESTTFRVLKLYVIDANGVETLIDSSTHYGATSLSGTAYTWDSTAVTDGDYTIVATLSDTADQFYRATGVTVTVANATGTITITDPLPGTCSSCSGGAVCSLFSGTFNASHPAGINFVQVWQDGVLFDTLDYSAAPPTTITGDGFALDNIPNNSCVTRSMYLVLVPVTGANIQSSTVTATKCNNAPCP